MGIMIFLLTSKNIYGSSCSSKEYMVIKHLQNNSCLYRNLLLCFLQSKLVTFKCISSGIVCFRSCCNTNPISYTMSFLCHKCIALCNVVLCLYKGIRASYGCCLSNMCFCNYRTEKKMALWSFSVKLF